MGSKLQDAGVEMVVVDNDRQAHSKATRVAFQKFGIKIWPGAGVVGDRKLIPEFTGKGIEDQGVSSEFTGLHDFGPKCQQHVEKQ